MFVRFISQFFSFLLTQLFFYFKLFLVVFLVFKKVFTCGFSLDDTFLEKKFLSNEISKTSSDAIKNIIERLDSYCDNLIDRNNECSNKEYRNQVVLKEAIKGAFEFNYLCRSFENTEQKILSQYLSYQYQIFFENIVNRLKTDEEFRENFEFYEALYKGLFFLFNANVLSNESFLNGIRSFYKNLKSEDILYAAQVIDLLEKVAFQERLCDRITENVFNSVACNLNYLILDSITGKYTEPRYSSFRNGSNVKKLITLIKKDLQFMKYHFSNKKIEVQIIEGSSSTLPSSESSIVTYKQN
jgi:hypothetical protein